MIQTTVGQKLTIVGVPKNAMLPTCVSYRIVACEPHNGRPTFKQKGKRKRFTTQHIENPEPGILVFDGWELPFQTEAESGEGKQYSHFVIDGKINLVGDPQVIRAYIREKNLNPNFSEQRNIYHIDSADHEKRTQLFPPLPILTPELEKQAREQFPKGDDMDNQVIVAKYTGRGLEGDTWTWYLMNQDPNDPSYLWGIVDGFAVETGSFSLEDLTAAQADRDADFVQRPAVELWNELRKRGDRQFAA